MCNFKDKWAMVTLCDFFRLMLFNVNVKHLILLLKCGDRSAVFLRNVFMLMLINALRKIRQFSIRKMRIIYYLI